MQSSKNFAWVRHLDTIADELVRLTAVCDVKLNEPQEIDRMLKNDETVCDNRNPIGFRSGGRMPPVCDRMFWIDV